MTDQVNLDFWRRDLGLIDAAAYRRFNRALTARGWHRGEPEEPEPEHPELVSLAFDALTRDRGERPADVARALGWRPRTLTEVTGVATAPPDAGPDAAGGALSLTAFRDRRGGTGRRVPDELT